MKIWINCLSLILLGLTTGTLSAKQVELPPFDPVDIHLNFTSPVDNMWLPMAIGDTYVYEAEEEDGLIHNEITATAGIEVILGVNCTIVYDVEWIWVEDLGTWIILEETYDWLAWDNWGNVWYFGEDTVEFLYDDDWNPEPPFISTEGSWRAGDDDAEPGILMLADPWPGLSYRQEYLEDEAEDMAKVLRLNASVSVEYDDFDGCLVTKEWTHLDPGAIEQKYYAPNVGLVYIKELNGKTVHVELVDIQ